MMRVFSKLDQTTRRRLIAGAAALMPALLLSTALGSGSPVPAPGTQHSIDVRREPPHRDRAQLIADTQLSDLTADVRDIVIANQWEPLSLRAALHGGLVNLGYVVLDSDQQDVYYIYKVLEDGWIRRKCICLMTVSVVVGADSYEIEVRLEYPVP